MALTDRSSGAHGMCGCHSAVHSDGGIPDAAEHEMELAAGCTYLGVVDYRAARKLQEKRVQERQEGIREDSVLLLQHPACITVGKRTCPEDILLPPEELARRGVDMFLVDRGGSATLHAPGQLVIYPIVSLRRRAIGVKRFVGEWLEILGETVREEGVPAEVLLDPAGLWTAAEPRRKLASCGLRIEEGVTNHGFALNVNLPLDPFQWIISCGLKGSTPTSIAEEQSTSKPAVEQIAKRAAKKLSSWLCNQPKLYQPKL